MKRRRPVHMLALVLGVVAAVPSIAAADTSFPAAAGDMTARGNLLVWTPWTGPGRLMSGFGDAAAPLPIPRARFGSVDLGTDARGRTVLVYRSCQAARPRHCAVYLYDFASQRHRRLAALDRSGCRVGDVRISRGTVAFARDCGGRALDGLYLKRPGKPVRRIRGVPAEGGPIRRILGVPAVLSFDLDGNTVAFIHSQQRDGPEEATWRLTTEVRVLQLGQRRSRLLARERQLVSPAPSGAYVQDVRLDSGFAYWERQVFTERLPAGDPPAPDRRERARDAARAGRPALRRTDEAGDRLGSYAVSGDRMYYSRPARVPRRSSPRWRVRPSSAEPAPRSQGASEGGWGSPCTRLRASSRSASVLTLVLD